MRTHWCEKEISDLIEYYVEQGLSALELYEKFKLKYPSRTLTSVKIKIKKLKLRHTKEQTALIKSRLNSGEKNAMFGKDGPNKGLNKNNSQRIREAGYKISKTRKKMYIEGKLIPMNGESNPMFGSIPWSKGKTKYTDEKLMAASNKISESKKRYWNSLDEDKKDEIVGRLSLAANMAKKDTKIEMIVKSKLDKLNIKYIKNFKCSRYIFDFYLYDYNFVIECQGDYWHGNPEYFDVLNEIQIKNKERDQNKLKYLQDNDINYLFLWENEIYKLSENLEEIILGKINESY